MNKAIKILYFLLLVCLALSLMAGCTASTARPAANGGEPDHPEQPNSNMSSSPADRVEVVYFHRTQRCNTCLYAEAGIRYTVETYFTDELASGKVTFEVLNVEDKENATVVEKYGASYLTLLINTIRNGTEHIEEVDEIWYCIGDDEAFIKTVKSEIEKSLSEVT